MTNLQNLPLADLALIFGLGEEIDWQERALCREFDPDIFYPEKGGSTREGKAVCARCDVRAQCLQYALDHRERFGIFGGLSETERSRLTRGTAA